MNMYCEPLECKSEFFIRGTSRFTHQELSLIDRSVLSKTEKKMEDESKKDGLLRICQPENQLHKVEVNS